MTSNSNKVVVVRREDSYGSVLDTYGAFQLRRTNLGINREVQEFSSNQMTTNRQETKIISGNESVSISLNSELSPSSYSGVLASYLARGFVRTNDTVVANLSITDAGSSWLLTGFSNTSIFKLGTVIRLSGSFVPSNNLTNLVITAIGTNSLNVVVLNKERLTEVIGISCTVSVIGTKSYIDGTYSDDYSFTLETYSPGLSEIYSGLVPSGVTISASTGISSIDTDFIAKNLSAKSSSQVFSTYRTFNSNPVVASDAMLLLNNTVYYVKDFTLSTTREISTTQDISSRTITSYAVNEYTTTCEFTTALTNNNLQGAEVQLSIILPSDSSKTSEFIRFTIPNSKVLSCNNDDGNILMQQFKIQAVYKELPNYENSTLIIQESSSAVWNWDDIDIWDDSKTWID